jgi:2,5-dihydroxypyridine 5,6-dioxygenase
VSEIFELVTLFDAVLELCKVKNGEIFAVLSEGGGNADYADAFLLAARERGASAYQVTVPQSVPRPGSLKKLTSLSGNTGAVAALKGADMILDLIGLLWSAEQRELQAAGARILTCRESAENIVRMFPTAELRRRVEAGAKELSSARRMHVTSSAGTDVVYQLGQYPVITQYGYTDEAGRWDNLPGGFLYSGGKDDGVDGIVVVAPGDMIFPFKRYLTDPIRLVIERGSIVRIEGDHLDAEILRDYMARWQDPRAYAVSHIGWGMDEKARWNFLATSPASSQTGRDGRAFYGNVLFSTGPNSELGGNNDTGCHLDVPLRNCSLILDHQEIIKNGTIVPAALRAAGR